MDIGQVGNNGVSACMHCDKLFSHKITEGLGDSITALSAMHEEHRANSPECQAAYDALPSLAETQAELKPMFEEQDAKYAAKVAANPDNGRAGWWRVSGVRHDAIARASSAREAIDKCEEAGEVGSWESPDVSFIGEELPDVLGM